MSKQSRVGDVGQGICPVHGEVITVFVSGMNSVLTNGKASCVVTSVGQCNCGHTSVAMSGSVLNSIEGKPVHRIGDVGEIQGGGTYTSLSGSPDTDKGDVHISPSRAEAIEGFQVWASIVDVAAQICEDQIGHPSPKQREIFEKAKIDPAQSNPAPPSADTTPVPQKVDTPIDCGSDINGQTTFAPNFQLSPNYVLAHLSTACALESSAVRAQAGLRIDQVVCNLRQLCVKIIEPLTAKYGRPSINCGFRSDNARYGASNSLHKYGRAADLQWGGISDEEYYARAIWIRDNLPFNELIIEYGGNRPWLHVAYDSNSSTRKCLSRTTVSNGYTQGLVLCKNVPKVGGTRI
jgi:hypothetical protein